MLIQLTNRDLDQMPTPLCTDLLRWLQGQLPGTNPQTIPSSMLTPAMPEQLNLEINLPMAVQTHSPRHNLLSLSQVARDNETQHVSLTDLRGHAHVKISQLFDMGLVAQATQLRVRLKRDKADQRGYNYVTTGIQVSSRGTVIYNEEEFNKPSPLAAKINGSSVNGWKYIQIKRNGRWVSLDELRKVWRNAHER